MDAMEAPATDEQIIEAIGNVIACLEIDDLVARVEGEDFIALREDWVTIDGRHIDIGADNAGEKLSKSEIAKTAYNGGGTKPHQDIAEATERDLSKGLGIAKKATIIVRLICERGKVVGIEVKTFVTNKAGKITMNKNAMALKKDAIAAHKLTKTYTIVADKRGDLSGSPKNITSGADTEAFT